MSRTRITEAVLGIDAAWTAGEPSGVALFARAGSAPAWRCVAIAPGYGGFLALAEGHPVDWRGPRPAASPPDPRALLEAARALLGGTARLTVAVDMPLANTPITCRRPADDAVSRALGRYKLGTHSPSPARPGPVASAMVRGFALAGIPLATTRTPPGTPSRLLEVFPHASAIALLGLDRRLPYKLGRARQYWPGIDATALQKNLLVAWRRLHRALESELGPVPIPYRREPSLARLKRYEDALDAALCAWTATEYLAGRAVPLGDRTAATWIARMNGR